jgi:predicted enzyme related to lactoylglutathione lyase
MTLAANLSDWVDADNAEHLLAKALGIMPRTSVMMEAKPVYFSNHLLGSELYALLERLTELGFLEKREEPELQYRVRPHFARRLGIEEIWAKKRLFPPSPALARFVLPCSAPVVSSRFYQALGIRFTKENSEAGVERYSGRLDNTVLELESEIAPATPVRLSLAIPDVAAAVAAVRTFGGTVVYVHEEGGSAVVQDPDGNTIELTKCSI